MNQKVLNITSDCKQGEWNYADFGQVRNCLVPAPDAGKVCTDGSQCTLKICNGGLHKTNPTSGKCAKWSNESTCPLKNGRLHGDYGGCYVRD